MELKTRIGKETPIFPPSMVPVNPKASSQGGLYGFWCQYESLSIKTAKVKIFFVLSFQRAVGLHILLSPIYKQVVFRSYNSLLLLLISIPVFVFILLWLKVP